MREELYGNSQTPEKKPYNMATIIMVAIDPIDANTKVTEPHAIAAIIANVATSTHWEITPVNKRAINALPLRITS
jgi:hypothetical protein